MAIDSAGSGIGGRNESRCGTYSEHSGYATLAMTGRGARRALWNNAEGGRLTGFGAEVCVKPGKWRPGKNRSPINNLELDDVTEKSHHDPAANITKRRAWRG